MNDLKKYVRKPLNTWALNGIKIWKLIWNNKEIGQQNKPIIPKQPKLGSHSVSKINILARISLYCK